MKPASEDNQYHRRSIRLRGFDYATAGAYFVTICTENREEFFGEVIAGKVRLNPAGHMVQDAWEELPKHYTGVDVDAFVIMPNHIHGILVLTEIAQNASLADQLYQALTFPEVVQRFKSFTTAQYRKGVTKQGWEPFHGRLWQRNYYEYIVRNDIELNQLREYIFYNPAN